MLPLRPAILTDFLVHFEGPSYSTAGLFLSDREIDFILWPSLILLLSGADFQG
jgi:hypothetical protein